MQNMSPREPLTSRVIGLAIVVHRELRPGLLETPLVVGDALVDAVRADAQRPG